MADDNAEDDLFADLYDVDEVAAPAERSTGTIVPPQKEAPTDAPSTFEAPAQQEEAAEPVPDVTITENNGPSNQYEYSQDDNGQQHNAQDHGTFDGHEENYPPVGIKEDGKMFIGGLNWETTDESLKSYFSEFGEVLECTVMRDGATGRSRGFGFLTFKDPKTVNTVMVKEHYLDGKIIDPKRAIPREEQERTSKIFVGGVSQEATERDFKEFFMNFGRVVDATLMMDKDTGRPRGFGFVTFDGDDAVDRTLAGPLEIHGKPIEVKRAQPRGNMNDDDRGGRFNRGGKFGNRQQDNPNFQNNQGYGADQQQNQGQPGMQQGMSPAMMAQYWSRMQQYFSMMQQQMAQTQMNPMAMMGGQMNPAQMQQMQQMMQMQQQAQAQAQGQAQAQQGLSPGGTPNPQSPGASSQPMSQQMSNQMNGNQGFMNEQGANGAANKAGYSAQEQLMFEQQKYERQQQQRMQQNQQYSQQYGGGNNQSWEGMYDDVPQPNQGGHQGRGGKWQNRHGGAGGGGGGQTPPVQPSNAPANAPTGPKNAGRPGANYRGGGRGGGRGWRPY